MVAQTAHETFPGPVAPTHMDEELQLLMRSFGVSAVIVRAGQGVVLEGVAATYYGKQMAQEIARKADMVVVANRIRVRPYGADSLASRS